MGFLNADAGAIQGIATIVLVLLTGGYVFFTYRLVSAARPYVHLDVSSESGGVLELAVANYGDRAGERISFDVKQDIRDRQGQALSESPPFARGISYLPPGRSYRWLFIAPASLFSAESPGHVFEATITYQHGRRKFKEKVNLDFSSLNGILLRSFRDPMAEVASHLRSISGSVSKPSRAFLVATTHCPFCYKTVSSAAKKCPHCLEWIAREEGSSSAETAGA